MSEVVNDTDPLDKLSRTIEESLGETAVALDTAHREISSVREKLKSARIKREIEAAKLAGGTDAYYIQRFEELLDRSEKEHFGPEGFRWLGSWDRDGKPRHKNATSDIEWRCSGCKTNFPDAEYLTVVRAYDKKHQFCGPCVAAYVRNHNGS